MDTTSSPEHAFVFWSGEFADRAEESAYLDDARASERTRSLIGLAVVLAAWTAFVFTDAWVWPETYHPGMTVVRGVGVLVALWALWPGADARGQRRQNFLTLLYMAWGAFAVMVIGGETHGPQLYQMSIVLVVLAAWGVFTFSQYLVIAATSVVTMVGATVWYEPDTALFVPMVYVVCVLVFTCGYLRIGNRRKRALWAARRALERVAEDREQLVGAVGHELRTPLGAMRMVAALLRQNAVPAQAPWLALLDGRIDVLEALVTGVMRLGSLSSSASIPRSEVRTVASVVEDARRSVGSVSEDVSFTMEGDPALTVACDAVLLSVLLANLISNACRYGRGRVAVSWGRWEDHVVIAVDDDGLGVPDDERATVFEPTARGRRGRAKDALGAGLGLAIAARVARGHGGRLDVGVSSDLGGARFEAWLPEHGPL